jgi:DNA-binding NarL/FixJ family response regulator
MTLAILLVDDHPVFLFGLRALIETQPDMAIAGEALTAVAALEIAARTRLDLAILDINLPDMSGVTLAARLKQLQPAIRLLALSMQDDDTLFKALQAGVDGYLVKGAGGDETLRAIRAVAAGEAIFSPSVARRLQNHFEQPAPALPFPELTPREREILELVAQGLTNAAIAARLSLSVKTVRNRISDIFSKLHVTTRAEAILTARQSSLGKEWKIKD